jgi:hypothetical protein
MRQGAGIDNGHQKLYEIFKLGGGDWFEPALNVHKPLSPTVTPIFLFAPPSTP